MILKSKLKILFDNSIKVYPVIKNYKMAVCVHDEFNVVYKKKLTVGEYKHSTRTINNALEKTIDFIYKKLTGLSINKANNKLLIQKTK